MGTRTIALTLRPSAEQAAMLERLQQQFNAACNCISREAWAAKEFRQFPLHHLTYATVRKEFGLLAQHAVRAIAVVADSYKADKSHQHNFCISAAVVLDTPRLYRLRATLASIATLAGRIEVPLAIGGKQREQLATATKLAEADLILDEKGRWRLLVTAHYSDPSLAEPADVLGIDMGIVNIAADSDGTVYSGAHLSALRHRHRRLRRRLHLRHTASARKLRCKRSRKEARFAKDVNHCISKRIVAVAERTGRAIALEDLGGIRERVTARRSQRATLHSWSFAQLREFIAYKAAMHGVQVVLVDPRNSSRTCPVCGCVDKRNRLTQACFSCVSCGFSGLADSIAAAVLRQRGRAVVNLPYILCSGVSNAGGTSPQPSGVDS
jgi:IS605 OrfB family transposase